MQALRDGKKYSFNDDDSSAVSSISSAESHKHMVSTMDDDFGSAIEYDTSTQSKFLDPLPLDLLAMPIIEDKDCPFDDKESALKARLMNLESKVSALAQENKELRTAFSFQAV